MHDVNKANTFELPSLVALTWLLNRYCVDTFFNKYNLLLTATVVVL